MAWRCVATALCIAGAAASHARAAGPSGSITGTVKVEGRVPANTLIRMGVDPLCSRLHAGTRVTQQSVVLGPEGGLGNAFVRLEGTFAPTPIPREPVVIDQRGCVYTPRIVGVRAGQKLQIKNSDPLLHNVHAISDKGNGFNVGQPQAGMVHESTPKQEDVFHLTCDMHRWMTAFVAVVNHPYFAVTRGDGTFTIPNVPPGTYTVRAWHERLGEQSQSVRIKPNASATVAFRYAGSAGPRTGEKR